MRFLIIVKASAASEAGRPPDPALAAAMAAYHDALAQAGVLLDANGLRASDQGWRVRYRGGQRSVIDGPFGQSEDLVAGYTLIQVRSRDEAMEWARRYPAPHGELADGEIEVRPLHELGEFDEAPPDDAAAQRLRALQATHP